MDTYAIALIALAIVVAVGAGYILLLPENQ